MDIDIKDVHPFAVQYIVDLIESDWAKASGNSARGHELFQQVWLIKQLLKQEITLDKRSREEGDESRLAARV